MYSHALLVVLLAGRCMALDREFAYISFMCIYYNSFVICWSPLGVLGTRFAFLGMVSGFLLGPFGAPCAPKGLLLGVTLAPLGCRSQPVGPFGTPVPPAAGPGPIRPASRVSPGAQE